MKNNSEIKISVRNLVEFVLRSGDLDNRFRSNVKAVEGTKAHQKLQKQSDTDYSPEVSMKYSIEYSNFLFIIEGRADGIIKKGNEIIIDEIKTVSKNLESIDEDYNMIHWAQAECYAHIYCEQNNLENISVQLTYFCLESSGIKRFVKHFTKEELKKFFFDLLDKYLIWAQHIQKWCAIRDSTIKSMNFPFESYREGQRDLAVAVYRTITSEKRIFVQAPTGIGKTMSTLFPGIKTLGEGHISKLFYLTAKTITRQAAEDSLMIMYKKGLKIKSVTLTAKDKICFNEGSACNPEECNYAAGHFDRVNQALIDILENESIIKRDNIEQYAKKYNVCPFEFSLDLTLFCDIVICDYNYVFDPRVSLKRFFAEGSNDFTFLIDEAHNLVDRAREMFSAELYKKTFLNLKRAMKEKEPEIAKVLNKLNSFMIQMRKICGEDKYCILDKVNDEMNRYLRKFIDISEEWLSNNEKSQEKEELLQLYFDVLSFIRISEMYDESYITYIEKIDDDVKLKLFCLDPSNLLKEALKKGKSIVFFSATLSPMNYFKRILGGSSEDYVIRLPSPFDNSKRLMLIASNISTRLKNREKTINVIADYINAVAVSKKGNYLVFFPSYKYMNSVYEVFCEKYSEPRTIIQSVSMTELEKEIFLEKFDGDAASGIIGFAVLGGIFSEGIDLTGDKLSGALIVGVGLPQICFERDIIMDYFKKKEGMGYEYAYVYPGIIKVMQAAGRVIRSENDKGVVLLIDDRFSTEAYLRLLPKEWFPNKCIRSKRELFRELDLFWKNNFL